MSVTTAAAADDPPQGMNADQWKRWNSLDDAGRSKVRDETVKVEAGEKCGNKDFKDSLGVQDRCQEVVEAGLVELYKDPNKLFAEEYASGLVCMAIAGAGVKKGLEEQVKAYGQACADGIFSEIVKGIGPAVAKTALGILEKIPGVSAAIEVVKFIADPKTALDNMANDFKSQSVDGTKQVLNSLTSVTGLDADSPEYRTVWAAYAGVGVVVMVLMMLMLFKRYGEGKISDDSFGTSMTYFLPGGFLLALYGPGLMSVLQGWSNQLTDGTSGWAAGAINNFIAVIANFGAMKQTDWFGSLLAIVLFGILLLGAFGLLVFLLLSPFFMGFAGLAVAILWGLALVPSMRPRLAKIGSVVVMMIFLKPLMFLLIGGAFSLMAATPAFKLGTDDTLVNVGSLAATGILLVMLTLSPALLFKFVPVLDADDVPAGAGGAALAGGVAGAMAGGVGRSFSSMRQGARERRRSAADASSGGSSAGGSWGGESPNVSSSSGGPGPTGRSSSPSASSRFGHFAGGPSGVERSGVASGPERSRTPEAAGDTGAVSMSSGDSGAVRHGRRAASSVGSSTAGPSAGSRIASAVGTPIKSGVVGALWAGRESARSARHAAADYGRMPNSWGNFKGSPQSKELE